MLDVTFYNLKQRGLYHEIFNALSERASLKNVSAIASMSEEERANHDDCFDEYIDNFQIGDEMYTLYAVMAHDTNYDALKSDVFKNGIINQTVLFAIVSAVIFIAAGKMYDKSKRLIILKESISSTELLEVPEDLRNWVFQQEDIQIINYDVHLDYDYYTANEVSQTHSI